MTTLRAIASEIIRKVPGEVGQELWREEQITSLTTTTIVSNALAVGGLSNDAYASKYLWRPDTTTTADKERYSTAYASSTGTLTHTGSNYSDTTATSESVIISKMRSGIIRKAIDVAIQRTKTIDRTELPMMGNQGWYSLGELDWIKSPSDIVKVCWDNSPVITRNRYFQKRNSVNSSGLFVPDWWTVTNNTSTAPFVATNYRGQKTYYEMKVAADTDVTVVQNVSALRTGVTGDFPAGETVTAVMVTAPTADAMTVTINDLVTGSNTGTSSGTSLQEVTAAITLPASSLATDLRITGTATTGNVAQPLYELYALVGTLTDAVRRDNFPEYELNRGEWDFDQNGVLTARFPAQGHGRFIIYSKRPYPGFDSTRLGSGAADADETDCPLQVAVAGALANIFLGINDPRYQFWENEYANQARNHIYGKNALNAQINFPLAPRARVF